MKNIIAFLIFCVSGYIVSAQTSHFSQFYSTPLLINPASTGMTDGPYRIASNYRSQWEKAGSPYKTFTISGDAQLMKDRLPEGNIFGLGLAIVNDKTLDGAVQTNTFAVSSGYHISLDEDNFQTLGLGFQGTYNERRIDFTRLQFENQYNGDGFDPNLPIGEMLPGGKKYFVDMNLGALYTFSMEDRSFFAGVAVNNLLKKQETYLTEQFKTPRLFSALIGGDFDMGFNNSLYFSGNYRQQGNSRETTVGMAYGRFLDQEGFTVLKLGVWYRVKDAMIPFASLTFNGLQVGCSFDYTVSSVKTRGEVRNAFEISVLYIRPDLSELKRMIPWY